MNRTVRRRRVAITGIGPVSAIGIGLEAFERGLWGGVCGTGPIEGFSTDGFPARNGAEIRTFDPGAVLRSIDPGEWGRSSQLVAVAARLALSDAGLERIDDRRAGACVGTTSGESQEIEAAAQRWVDDPAVVFGAADYARASASRLAIAVSRELGLLGESLTFATACSAGNVAFSSAFDRVAYGEADLMIAGGADAICRWAHAGFYRLGALSGSTCSPFDADREGLLTGEGGIALVLESLDAARSRGARIYAEVLGYGANCDAAHMVAPNQARIEACMRLALADSSLTPDQIDYICAHGTATTANDLTEGAAIRSVYGQTPPPVSSIKSMLGHTMGAASGFGIAASALAISRGVIPPTINFSTIDPGIGWMDPVPNAARRARVRYVQNNGFGFGGNNAIVILGGVDV